MSGPVCYWNIHDIAQSVRAVLDPGAVRKQDVTDVGGGELIPSAMDADGNDIGLLQPA
jgi:hypothetical protein